MVIGTVLRSHAGGYLVYANEPGVVLQCAARGRLKKEQVSIVTGDRVELDEIDSTSRSAVIVARLERTNLLSRPLIAGVDQVIIVQSVHQPEWNALLCDRYLVHFQLELPSTRPILCFNKSDLASSEDLATLQKIYEPLEYFVAYVSAATGAGLEQLIERLAGKISVLAGPSGVGKSSLINYLDPSLKLKVGEVDEDIGRGKHTTTGSELYRIHTGVSVDSPPSWVADTPGFSLAELKHPEPNDVFFQFPEIERLYAGCKYSNCLHLTETGCNVLANLNQISPSRYESYTTLVKEAIAESKSRRDSTQKVESAVKLVGGGKEKGVAVPRLSGRYRANSRRLEKQRLSGLDIEEEKEHEGG